MMRIASASSTRWATFRYDGKRRRRVTREETKGSSGQWVLASETRYVYDGMRVIQERTSNGVPTVAYTRGPDLSGTLEGAGGIGGLLARSEWNSVSSTWSHAFYHSDGVGNVTALAVPNGNDIALAGSYRYDPFGRLIGTPTDLAARNTQRFSSKDWHNASGFYYFGYRFYDPATQRWLNRDPIGEEGGVNLYGYVGNNPLTYWDAFGLTIVYDFDPMPGDDPNSNGPYARNFDDGSNLFKPLLKLNPCQLYKEMDRIKATLAKKPWWKRFDPMDEAGFDTTYFKGTEGDDRQYYSYDGKIYADNEINYFGIGMYDSWAGKPDWASDSQTSFWKKWQYNQSPNENTYYWLQQGRSNYGPPDNSNIPTIPEGRRRN